jgi:hypothetical protein
VHQPLLLTIYPTSHDRIRTPFVSPYACLVDVELTFRQDLTMTSGFSTIAGSVLSAYITLGVPAQNLITSSVMSIPSSIAISKIRMPETEEPVTRGQVVVDRGEDNAKAPVSWNMSVSSRTIAHSVSIRRMPSMRSVKEHFSALL